MKNQDKIVYGQDGGLWTKLGRDKEEFGERLNFYTEH